MERVPGTQHRVVNHLVSVIITKSADSFGFSCVMLGGTGREMSLLDGRSPGEILWPSLQICWAPFTAG